MFKINVFFAYQFANSQISVIERERIYTNVLESINYALNQEGKLFELNWEYWNIQSGKLLNEEIFIRMDDSDIFVFDLSDDNQNVFIELGYSIAATRILQKKMVVLLHSNKSVNSLPSDISGMFILRVNQNTFEQKLKAEIYTKAKSIVATDRLIQEFWNPKHEPNFDIVCPVLPENSRSKHASIDDANYLRYLKFADLDTLFYLRSKLFQYFPNKAIFEYTSDEYSFQSNSNCLIIGGPVWNTIAQDFQKTLPLRFIDGGVGKDDPVEDCFRDDKCKFYPELRESEIVSDISYFARINQGDKTNAFLISGCRTLGVLGAAKVFCEESVSSQNINLISDLAEENDFILVFKTRVIGSRIIPTLLKPHLILSLYIRLETGEFKKYEFS